MIVLDQRCEQPSKLQPLSVQRVAELIFPIDIFVTKIHPARLKTFKIRAARNFEIPVLARRPNLDVVSLCRAKSEIASTKFHDSIMQSEQLKHPLRVTR